MSFDPRLLRAFNAASASSYLTLSDALAAAVARGGPLYIDTVVTQSTDITLTVPVVILPGAMINASGHIVTYSQGVTGPMLPIQIFGTGTHVISVAQSVMIDWWQNDNTTSPPYNGGNSAMAGTLAGSEIRVYGQHTTSGIDVQPDTRDQGKSLKAYGGYGKRSSATGAGSRLYLMDNCPARSVTVTGTVTNYMSRNVLNFIGKNGNSDFLLDVPVWGNRENNRLNWSSGSPYQNTVDGYPGHGVYILNIKDLLFGPYMFAEHCCNEGVFFDPGPSGSGFSSNSSKAHFITLSGNTGHGIDLGGFSDGEALEISSASNGDGTKSGVSFVRMRDYGLYSDITSLAVVFSTGTASGTPITQAVPGGYQIVGVMMTSNGGPYTTAPTVSFTGGTATRAAVGTAVVPWLGDGIYHTGGNIMVAIIRSNQNAHNGVSGFGSNLRAGQIHSNTNGANGVEITGDHTQCPAIYVDSNGSNASFSSINRSGVYVHANADDTTIGGITGRNTVAGNMQQVLSVASTGLRNRIGPISVSDAMGSGQVYQFTSSAGVGLSNSIDLPPASIAVYAATITVDPGLSAGATVNPITGDIAFTLVAASVMFDGMVLVFTTTQDGSGLHNVTFNSTYFKGTITGADTTAGNTSQWVFRCNNNELVQQSFKSWTP